MNIKTSVIITVWNLSLLKSTLGKLTLQRGSGGTERSREADGRSEARRENNLNSKKKESLVFISSSLAIAALRPDGGSSPLPYRTEGGDVTPVRNPAKFCPGASIWARGLWQTVNPACRQSNLHPHQGGRGGRLGVGRGWGGQNHPEPREVCGCFYCGW